MSAEELGNGVYEIGDENFDRVLRDTSARFTAEEGAPYRLSFVWWPALPDGVPDFDGVKAKNGMPRFIAASSVYIKGVGSVIVPKGQTREYEDLAGEESKPYAATLIAEWPLTRKGKLDGDALKEGEVTVWPWRIPLKKYNSLESHHASTPFSKSDLRIECSNKQYQTMELFAVTGENGANANLYAVLRAKGGFESVLKKIEASVKEQSATLATHIGLSLSLDAIRRRLAGGEAGSGGRGGPRQNLAAAASAASAVEDVLSGVLTGSDD